MFTKGIVFLITTAALAHAYSSGPPAGYTGGFGEPTCMACHEFKAGDGSFVLYGVPDQYIPGEVYQIVVELAQVGQLRWGFELAARFQGDASQAGTIAVTDNVNTQLDSFTGIQYIEHTFFGTYFLTPDGPVTWTFNWIAPDEAMGPVVFNAAGNAANGDGLPDGDFIYTLEYVSAAPEDPPK